MALIKCENVSIGYEGQTIVRDLNFEIGQGDYLCIVGENGSGKSTLVKSLLGLKAVDSGKIEFGDGLKQKEIGYLPQQNDFQKDFPASVYEVVLSGRLNSRGFRPFYTATDKAEAAEKMEMLGITDLRGQCFRDLSGGQKQRVLLARALCATKKLLLLDEPVTVQWSMQAIFCICRRRYFILERLRSIKRAGQEKHFSEVSSNDTGNYRDDVVSFYDQSVSCWFTGGTLFCSSWCESGIEALFYDR